MNTKNNKRFHDTEIRMEAAMLEIMKNTEFEKITVKKICEKAEINRSTFYAHFIDIYDMIDKMEKELSKELLNQYSAYSELQVFSEESFIPFLRHIKKHKYFYKINLQTRKDFPLKQGFERLWEVIKNICIQNGITSDEEIMYYLIYFQAGFTMTLKHWVDTDCKEDETKLAKIIRKCIPSTLSS
ncbi:MAG: TetR/AcrR family transcriptional regulator [Clostridium sp.]|nr:TetR/AcrR family transcriptional regulator [Clostridium sp.]